jgi:cAMP-dependent protein kinase regulator
MDFPDESAMPGDGDDQAQALARTRQCFLFLRGVPVLLELDESALWQLAQHATEETVPAGELVLCQGEDEPDKRFFIIRSGVADVLRRDPAGAERVVARLACGSYFGELGLLTNQARNATVRVRQDRDLVVYSFDALAFHRLVAENVLVFRLARERRRAARQGRPNRLRIRELEILREMPKQDLDYVLAAAEHRWFHSGAEILTQGDPGDRFYILLDGEVAVERDDELLASLGPGSFFGETALLFDTTRTATIRATRETLTWSITRSAFQRVVGHYLLSHRSAHATIMRRVRSMMPGEAA